MVTEKEEFVLDDGSAYRAAILLPVVRRRLAGKRILRGIDRIQVVEVASPVEFVAPGLGLSSHDASQGFAELSVVVLGCDFGLGHRIQTGVHNNDTENRILVIGAVQLVSRATEVLAVHEDLLAALRILRGGVAPA